MPIPSIRVPVFDIDQFGNRMLTVSDNEEDVLTALRLGADGYLLKDMEPDELVLHGDEVPTRVITVPTLADSFVLEQMIERVDASGNAILETSTVQAPITGLELTISPRPVFIWAD